MIKNTILITGSSKGIGFEYAKSLMNKNITIILNSRLKNKNISNLLKKKNYLYVKGDITSKSIIEKIKKILINNKLKLKYVVSNVGYSFNSKIMDNEKFKKYLNLNLYSTTNIYFGLNQILKKNKSKIICISSIASDPRIQAPIGYQVAKAALNTFVQSCSKNYKKNNIFICGLLVGHTIHDNSVWKYKSKKEISAVLRKTSYGKFIETSEISSVISNILFNKLLILNGSLINCEGGIS